ncbi:haloacid dehalogenase type II [Burkholderia pseudomultivorans]|uniref:Haloacid dehalogenase, type II n=1 Tax=Burkholderia cenocepacia TaxID=95486 RepID=A0AAN0VPQ4_9BURK|nr:haloacid dehalogenase type II [Burkholderia pseudomultivorans]AIO34999.1 haloacid dehalogenase, type II [Burkholderia cenocepacia]EGD05300.1 haloacid dehalogenase, type II [Burkholderia sp. TJI49]AOI88811.1 haloacid dehalogenase [Burkholderia pseudomultivorans]KVC30867.1 haloacid dehalogenase [Burkholderia pseudomultivorans]KVC31119.1 haloacid dehalogenase [Burkholderia pseudomultivorans]
MNPTEIKAFVFDVFGTIVDWRSRVAREAADFLQTYAPTLDAFEFADAWRREYTPSMEEVRSGRRSYVRLDLLHRENLVRIIERYGIAGVPDAAVDALNLAWHRLDPWPDSVAALNRLKQRFIIAPLSNGNIRLMIDIAKHAGLPWDAILGAEVAHAYKPAPKVYNEAVEILGVAPAEVCLVAAHNSDLAAARRLGLSTAFVPRPTEYGPGQTTDLNAEDAWDFVVADLHELADRVGCPR